MSPNRDRRPARSADSGAGRGGGSGTGRPGKPGRSSAGRSASGGQGPQRGLGAGGGRAGGRRSVGGSGRADAAPAKSSAPVIDVHDPDGVRLQKLLAAAGVGSRRVCEKLIVDGRVAVDGHVVRELGVRIDPITQSVHVDGSRVQLDTSQVYFAFNKPLGVVSTMSDELGRPCVGDYLAKRPERLFHVGRLDADTQGLILLTNDGELSHRLQHPSYEIPKTYIATVPGPVARDVGRRLRQGVELEDGHVAVDSFKLIDSLPGRAIVEVILHEGRKHVVRRLLEAVGHPVETLSRVQVGPVHLRDLTSGRMRPLNGKEIAELYKAAGL
ncbi:MAG: pseudouridine synthase [Micrococcales bacterium]|nr:pseudouridine synthase [Micrococcales bacterium]